MILQMKIVLNFHEMDLLFSKPSLAYSAVPPSAGLCCPGVLGVFFGGFGGPVLHSVLNSHFILIQNVNFFSVVQILGPKVVGKSRESQKTCLNLPPNRKARPPAGAGVPGA